MLTLPELTLQHITTERYNMDTTQLKRIADAMEEILRLVKEDQEQYKKKPKSKIEESLIKQNYK
jgi:hypothetical protein